MRCGPPLGAASSADTAPTVAGPAAAPAPGGVGRAGVVGALRAPEMCSAGCGECGEDGMSSATTANGDACGPAVGGGEPASAAACSAPSAGMGTVPMRAPLPPLPRRLGGRGGRPAASEASSRWQLSSHCSSERCSTREQMVERRLGPMPWSVSLRQQVRGVEGGRQAECVRGAGRWSGRWWPLQAVHQPSLPRLHVKSNQHALHSAGLPTLQHPHASRAARNTHTPAAPPWDKHQASHGHGRRRRPRLTVRRPGPRRWVCAGPPGT
jgi:hypothetical protein